MVASQDETGCDAFNANVSFDSALTGSIFRWGVIADIAGAPNSWVVVTEVPDENSSQRCRSFALAPGETWQDYWFATGRRFGLMYFCGDDETDHGHQDRQNARQSHKEGDSSGHGLPTPGNTLSFFAPVRVVGKNFTPFTFL